jgi:hypothetical protein
MKPFKTRDGRVIVDQLCRCGHRFSKHGHRLAHLPDQVVTVANHGPCLEAGCVCQRFTFAGYVFQDEQPQQEEQHEP